MELDVVEAALRPPRPDALVEGRPDAAPAGPELVGGPWPAWGGARGGVGRGGCCWGAGGAGACWSGRLAAGGAAGGAWAGGGLEERPGGGA